MITDNDIHIIEKYLDGTLDKKSLNDFNKRVKEDKEFEKLLTERKRLSGLWKEADEYEQVKDIVKQVMSKTTPMHKISNKKFYYLAATVVLLIGLTFFLYQRNKKDAFNGNPQVAETGLTEKDSTSFRLKKDIPVTYASVDSVKKGTELIFPGEKAYVSENGTVEFKWKSTESGTDTLIIKKTGSDTILFSKKIDLQKEKQKIKINFTVGNYFWYLKGQKDSLKFEVKN